MKSGAVYLRWECDPTLIWPNYQVYSTSLSQTDSAAICILGCGRARKLFVAVAARRRMPLLHVKLHSNVSLTEISTSPEHRTFFLYLLSCFPPQTHLTNKRSELSHVVCSDTFWFLLDFSLCETKANQGGNTRSLLINWFRPDRRTTDVKTP